MLETTFFCHSACEALALVDYDCSALDLEGWLVAHGWTHCPEEDLRGCCNEGAICAGQPLPACCVDVLCKYLAAKCKCENLAAIHPSPPASSSCDLNDDDVVNCADLNDLLGGLVPSETCPESVVWILDVACCFLSKIQTDCGDVWTPDEPGESACTDIRECLEARIDRPLTAEELQKLMDCYGGDVSTCGCCREAPGGTGYFSCDDTLVCDRNGDDEVDCEDLKQLLEDSKALCNGGGDLTDEETLDIACVFVDSCAPSIAPECQAFLATMIDCLEEELCRSLTKEEVEALGVCTESCDPAGCCSGAGGWSCGETFRCDRANCDGVIDCVDIGAFVAESEAGCNGGEPYSRAERVELICDFFEHCGASAGSDICADIEECLEGILGGELTTEEKTTLAECTGCDDLCPPNDGEEQDKPDEGDEGCDGQASRGSGPGGTDAAYGDVTRSDNDLVVPAAGPTLALSREYTSDPAFESGCGNPEGWTNSALRHVDDSEAGTLRFMGDALGAVTVATSGSGPWSLPGPTSRVLSQASATVDGGSVNVWRVTDPGRTTTDYFRTSGSGDPELAALNGLLLQTQDPSGNIHLYDYSFYGLDNPEPRLRRIFVNGSASAWGAGAPPDALVEFEWIVDGADLGRLRGTSVFRFNGTQPVLTQRVAYTYFDSATQHADVGTAGDLVQVITSERVDPIVAAGSATLATASWRHRVTQYRYHRVGEGGSFGVTDRYTWGGGDHQIKFVIEPEQFEFLAQRLAAEEQSTSTTPILYDVDHFAAEVLAMADGAPVWAADLNGDGVADSAEEVPLVDFATMVAESYQTSGERRVLTIYSTSDGGCGSCGVSGTQGSRLTYVYTDRDSDPSVAETVKVEERLRNSSGSGYEASPYRNVWLEYYRPAGTGTGSVPYLRSSAVEDPAVKNRYWVTLFDHNASSRTLRAEYTPASISDYTPGTPTAPPSYTYAKSGLVRVFAYTADSRITRRERSDGQPTFSGANCTDCEWLEQTLYGSGKGNTRKHLPTEHRRYRKDPNALGFNPSIDVETTKYTYAFHGGGGDDIAWAKTEVEAELVAENGPGTHAWYASYEFYDTRGDNVWSVAADNAIVAREFDAENTGQIVKVVRNAPNAMPSSIEGLSTTGFGRSSDGGSLETRFFRDILGRVRSVEEPGDVRTYTLRNMFGHPDRPGIRYFCEITLPAIIDGSVGEYAGPATATWSNAGGQSFATSGYRPGIGGYQFAPTAAAQVEYPILISGYTLAEELSRRIVRHDVSGQTKVVMDWNALTGPAGDPDSLDGPNNGVHVTLFGQDRLGRPSWTINANGTAQRMAYDVLDRVVTTEIGIADTTTWVPDESTMTVVMRHFYDSGGTATQGVGNGNLTRFEQVVDASASRATVMKYDWRDRRYSTVNPLAPHGWTEYDNLDRVVKEATFTAEPTAIDAPLNSGANYRGRYSETSYSQRGLVYRQAVATNPKSSSPSFIESHTWFDQTGRPVGTWGPNGPGQKTTYDGLGRAKVSYSTDQRGDPLPGASGSFAAVFNLSTHEANVTDDVVLEQANTRYIADRGLVDLVTRRQRTHDAGTSDVGALDSGGYPSNKAITTYSGAWYDVANRPIREAQFGTNASGFQSGGTAPTVSQASPPSSNAADTTKLVTETRYDPRGLIESLTDPMGRVTRFHYDALGRRIMLIENFDAADPVVFGWESGIVLGEYVDKQRWVVTDGLDFDEPDRNRATSFVHDGLGNVVRQVAYLVQRDVVDPGPPPIVDDQIVIQETAYLYGVSPTTGSSITSYDLLGMVFYPDSDRATTHLGPIDEPQPVRFAYNRQTEVVTMRDANETEHVYTRDSLGRVTLDKATVSTSMPGFQVDGTVNAVASEFDTLGRLRTSRSYTDYGGGGEAVVNAAQLGYDDLWQVTSVTQQPDGDISGGSKSVGLSYDIQPVASGNRSRRIELTYPDGWDLGTTYGSSGSIDDRISRTRDLRDSTTAAVYAQYDWIGGGVPAIVTYGIPTVTLSRFLAHNGTSSTGTYPGLDRFGRVSTQRWTTSGFGPHATDTDVPNKPPLVETAYLYDNASSRTGAFDGRPGSVQPLSQSYDYDGLHRLDEAIRGAWNHNLASPTVTQNRDSQDWSLDPLGNWLQVATDLDGTGGFDADETETRDFRDPSTNTNRVNELFGRTLAVDAGGDELALTYDFAGNILRQELTDDGTDTTALRYTHDAWNRLVKVQFEDEEEDLHPRGEYEYNGLNWRTIRRADTTPADATHALDQKRLMYYGPEWQLLEERIDDAYPSSPGINRHTQYVWGVRYIDDSVASRQDYDPSAEDGSELVTFHLTDAQFSTVAVIGTDASVLERVAYTAYGVARHQWRADITGDGAVDGADLGILFGAYGATIDDAGYLSEADLNLDGIINGMDTGILLGGYQSALAPGVLSSPLVDNQVGFDGYLLAAETQMYIARNRWYLPPLGRWGQRDPIEFVDGMSLYEFLQSSPQSRFDPLGTTTARELLLSYLLEAIQAGVHFDLVPPPRIPVAPGLFLRVTIELKGQASRCCNPETRQIEWWGDVKLGVEISAEAGTTVGRQPKEEPVKGRDRNQRVPHPCVPGETVKKKNYHKTLRECIEKQRSGSGGIGGFVRAKSCGKEGIGFEGYIFVRGSAGVGVGIEFEIEYEIHPDDPLSLDHVNFSGGVGWVGYGASIQFGGGGRGFYKGPIPMLN